MARILVVEDSRTQALIFQFLLKKAGFEVEVAENGVAALAAIDRAPPDLVLTDLQMPEMDGVELVKALSPRQPAVPVVLMTGEGSEELALQALQHGAVAIASKQDPEGDCLKQVQLVLGLAAALRGTADAACAVEVELKFKVANEVDVSAVVDHVLRELAALQWADRLRNLRTGVALATALEIALRRGPLQLDAHLTRLQATFAIRGAGECFDSAPTSMPMETAEIGNPARRGMLLMRLSTDELSFNAAGSEVTLKVTRKN